MTTMTEQTTQVYSIFIRATPEQVWDAITKPEFTTRYFYGTAVESTFAPDAPYLMTRDGQTLVDGTVLEAHPPRLLRHSWRSLYDEATAQEPHSRVTWEIEPQEGGMTKLTVVHDELEAAPRTAENVAGGWMFVLSGLKTLLETGEPLGSD